MLDEDAGVRAEVLGELSVDRLGADAQPDAPRPPADAAQDVRQPAEHGEFVRLQETVFVELEAHAVGDHLRQPAPPARRLPGRDGQRHRRAVAPHAQRHGPARRRLLDEPRELAGAAHPFAVERHDDVAGLDAGGVGGAVRAHARHHRSFVHAVAGGVFDVPHRDADRAAFPPELDPRPYLALDLLGVLWRPRRGRRHGQGGENRAAPEQACDAGRLHW